MGRRGGSVTEVCRDEQCVTHSYVRDLHVTKVCISSDYEVGGSALIIHVIVALLAGPPREEEPLLVDGAPACTLMDDIAVHGFMCLSLTHTHTHTHTHTLTPHS